MSEQPYLLITADTHAGGNHSQYPVPRANARKWGQSAFATQKAL
jgi:hypothetical protein